MPDSILTDTLEKLFHATTYNTGVLNWLDIDTHTVVAVYDLFSVSELTCS